MAKTIVLVTGANKGIGLQIVKVLLESAPSDSGSLAPYHVYLGSRDLKRGEAAAATLECKHGNSLSVVQLDITSASSVAAAVATVEKESGRLDVLINNAGISDESIADEVEKMATLYATNVIGPYRTTAAFKPLLLKQSQSPVAEEGGKKQKRIVFVTSSMGSVTARFDPTYPTYTQLYNAYRCTKAALDMLAACEAYDLRDAGVVVHAFDPGWAATELGGGDPATLRSLGAVDPRVSGLACRDIVEGKRDTESEKMISINGDTYGW
ncbi:NAD(P)-binding protein [Nemania sp. FL0916]|nr:NAD(P)-binding protein [Nemania sp. FL0916]